MSEIALVNTDTLTIEARFLCSLYLKGELLVKILWFLLFILIVLIVDFVLTFLGLTGGIWILKNYFDINIVYTSKLLIGSYLMVVLIDFIVGSDKGLSSVLKTILAEVLD